MLHLTKKSNKMVGENTLLEKRIKKVEKSIEHINMDLNGLKLLLEGGTGPLDTEFMNKGSNPSETIKPNISPSDTIIGDIDDIPLDDNGPKDIDLDKIRM